MYNQNNVWLQGNDQLKPETINTVEIGLSGKVFSNINYAVTGFSNQIKNTIATEALTSGNNVIGYKFQNYSNIKSRGLEFALKLPLTKEINLGANTTYQDSRTADDERTEGIPRIKGVAFINYLLNPYISLYSDLYYMSAQPKTTVDSIPAFYTINTNIIPLRQKN